MITKPSRREGIASSCRRDETTATSFLCPFARVITSHFPAILQFIRSDAACHLILTANNEIFPYIFVAGSGLAEASRREICFRDVTRDLSEKQSLRVCYYLGRVMVRGKKERFDKGVLIILLVGQVSLFGLFHLVSLWLKILFFFFFYCRSTQLNLSSIYFFIPSVVF